jgi:hypothetical protein
LPEQIGNHAQPRRAVDRVTVETVDHELVVDDANRLEGVRMLGRRCTIESVEPASWTESARPARTDAPTVSVWVRSRFPSPVAASWWFLHGARARARSREGRWRSCRVVRRSCRHLRRPLHRDRRSCLELNGRNRLGRHAYLQYGPADGRSSRHPRRHPLAPTEGRRRRT